MKVSSKHARLAVGVALGFVVLAVAGWMLAIQPKRDQVAELGRQIELAEASLAENRALVAEGEEARKGFAADYRQLVVLGKAVPRDDETPSLLVQVSAIAERAKVDFRDIQLQSEGGGEAPEAAAPVGEGASATEVAAALLPLGASVGTAGLAVMPYSLTFEGSFSRIADFIHGLDALVKTDRRKVAVDGRLLTLDGFSLAADPVEGFPALQASFAITTYVTPPGEDLDGSGSAGSSPAIASPASTTIEGAP